MSSKLNKNQIERFSRQIILKDIGSLGQKKIKQAKVLIIGAGGAFGVNSLAMNDIVI